MKNKNLLVFLHENYFIYENVYNLLHEKQPYFIEESLNINEIKKGKIYLLSHDFIFPIKRKLYYYVSITDDNLTKNELMKHIDAENKYELYSNYNFGENDLIDKRNTYFICGNQLEYINTDFVIKRLNENDAYLLDELENEITSNGFENFEILQNIILENTVPVYALLKDNHILSYLKIHLKNIKINGMEVAEHTIYTVEQQRKKGYAFLILNNVISLHYKNTYIIHGTGFNNYASNGLAKKIGMNFITTNYRYSNYLPKI